MADLTQKQRQVAEQVIRQRFANFEQEVVKHFNGQISRPTFHLNNWRVNEVLESLRSIEKDSETSATLLAVTRDALKALLQVSRSEDKARADHEKAAEKVREEHRKVTDAMNDACSDLITRLWLGDAPAVLAMLDALPKTATEWLKKAGITLKK